MCKCCIYRLIYNFNSTSYIQIPIILFCAEDNDRNRNPIEKLQILIELNGFRE